MLSELWADLRYRFRALVRRNEMERELSDELRFHLEREVEKYERQGVAHAEAVRRARLAFGGVDRAAEESRDARGTVMIEAIAQDLRYALRGLRGRPAFSLGVIVTLALGIGANAAMFGITDRLLFRAPPNLRAAGEVHRVYLSWFEDGSRRVERNMAFREYLDLARDTRSFSSFAAFQTNTLAVGDGIDSRERNVTVASASYFDFFDARPALGRFYSKQEDVAPRGSPVVVLGYSFWQNEFGGRRDILGHQLRVGKTLCTIIGVAPEHFVGMSDQGIPAAFMPISAYAWGQRETDYTTTVFWSWLELVARRKADVSEATANADLTNAFRRTWITAAASNPGIPPVDSGRPAAELGPVQAGRGPQASNEAKVVTWVSGVAFIVLLIACANVANLLLSRAVKRRREIALRLALGVSRARLARQLLTESLVLAVIGGILGILIAQWGGASLAALFLSGDASMSVVSDARTLAVALVATMAAALLTGLAPALHSMRGDLARSLGAGARDTGGGAQPLRARTALLVLQAMLSMVLLVGAGLFVRSLQNVRGMRLGYDVGPVIYVLENPRNVRLAPAEAIALEQRLLDEATRIPGVVAATPAVSVPFRSNEGRGLFIEGVDDVRKRGRFILQAGGPDYFKTVGTRILRGRAFDRRDAAYAPGVVVISDGMARVLWPGLDALGKCIRIGADTSPCSTVIGIAEDMRVRSLTDEREHAYYIPFAQYDIQPAGALLVRVNGDATDYADLVRRRLQQLMPGSSYVTTSPFYQLVEPTMRSWQFGATMFVAFGGLALSLAGIGLYSVIAYGVAQRRQEIGVRLALGASRANVVRLILRGGLRFVIAGIAMGGVIALWSGRWIGELLFHESPHDPVVYVSVTITLIVVAVAATIVPALAASRVDPSVTLRAD